MEFFDSRLYNYPGRVLLLYGKESYFNRHKQFHWLEPGWTNAFQVVPQVDWIPGAHGEFFNQQHIVSLAEKVDAFLYGDAKSESSWKG